MRLEKDSPKKQIPLPAGARRKAGMKPHDRVGVEAVEEGILVRPAPDFFALEGFLLGRPSDAEMRAGMMKAVARHVLGGGRTGSLSHEF